MESLVVAFTTEDVMHIRPNLTQEQAAQALDAIERSFLDRMIEEGWDILDMVLTLKGYEDDSEEAV
jgi:hypothetical protein